MKKKFLLPLAIMMLMPLASCTQSCKLSDPDKLLDKTPITDSMKLNLEYEGKKFAHVDGAESDHIGRVTVKGYTDGDTTNFTEEGHPDTIKVRYLGVNTPESTAKVDPWGKKASNFTKHTLEEAVEVVLVNDVDVFGEYDGSGGRWLGFVWYRKEGQKDLRCLNLEIVEQGFSNNHLFKDSTRCPYRSYFEKAEANAKKCGIRVPGEAKDPGFDYTERAEEVSLRTIREFFDEYGISESGSSGIQLIITGCVIGFIGDSPILRDVADPDPETGEYATMYCYAGYSSGLTSIVDIGDVVKFYCRATKFGDNIQMSDLHTNTSGDKHIEWWTSDDPEYAGFHIDLNPVDVDESALSKVKDLGAYDGKYCVVDVEIRTVTPSTDDDTEEGESGSGEEYYYKENEKTHAMTVYAWANKANHVTLNIRVDGNVADKPFPEQFKVGHTYRVYGYVQKYFDKYQIMVFNDAMYSIKEVK